MYNTVCKCVCGWWWYWVRLCMCVCVCHVGRFVVTFVVHNLHNVATSIIPLSNIQRRKTTQQQRRKKKTKNIKQSQRKTKAATTTTTTRTTSIAHTKTWNMDGISSLQSRGHQHKYRKNPFFVLSNHPLYLHGGFSLRNKTNDDSATPSTTTTQRRI